MATKNTKQITAVKTALKDRGYDLHDRVNGDGAWIYTRGDTRIAVFDNDSIDFYGSTLEVMLGSMKIAEFLEIAA